MRSSRPVAVVVASLLVLAACGEQRRDAGGAESPSASQAARPPTSTVAPTTLPESAPVVVSPYVAEYFLDSVVQEQRDGGRYVTKWTDDVAVAVTGTPTAADLEVIDDAVARLGPAMAPLSLTRTTDVTAADVVVHVVPKSQWAVVLDDPEVDRSVSGWTYTYSGGPTVDDAGALSSAVVAVDADAPQSARNRVLVHELGHALGLGHGTCRASLMHPGGDSSPLWSPTPLDLEMLRVLYDPAMPSGADDEEAAGALEASAAEGPACGPVRFRIVTAPDGTEYFCEPGDDTRPCVRFDGREPVWPVEAADAWTRDGRLSVWNPDRWRAYEVDGTRLLCARDAGTYSPCVFDEGAEPDWPVTEPDAWTDGTYVYDEPPT